MDRATSSSSVVVMRCAEGLPSLLTELRRRPKADGLRLSAAIVDRSRGNRAQALGFRLRALGSGAGRLQGSEAWGSGHGHELSPRHFRFQRFCIRRFCIWHSCVTQLFSTRLSRLASASRISHAQCGLHGQHVRSRATLEGNNSSRHIDPPGIRPLPGRPLPRMLAVGLADGLGRRVCAGCRGRPRRSGRHDRRPFVYNRIRRGPQRAGDHRRSRIA